MIEQLPTTIGFELEFSAPAPAAESLPRTTTREQINRAASAALEAARQAQPETPPTGNPPFRVRRPRRPRRNLPIRDDPVPVVSETSILRRLHEALTARGYESTNHGTWRRSPISFTSWDLKTDASCGFEAASPVISKYSDLDRHSKVGQVISEVGGVVNHKCGLHVHLGAGENDISNYDLECFMRLCIRYESAFFMLADISRHQSMYCKGLSTTHELITKEIFRHSISRSTLGSTWGDKNTWLNMLHMGTTRTIEIRLMLGSLDPDHIRCYCLFLLHVLDAAKKGRKVRWGKANAKDGATLFRSLLGAAGFYEPVTDINHDYDRAAVARKWANQQLRKLSPDLIPSPRRAEGSESVDRIFRGLRRLSASDDSYLTALEAVQNMRSVVAVDPTPLTTTVPTTATTPSEIVVTSESVGTVGSAWINPAIATSNVSNASTVAGTSTVSTRRSSYVVNTQSLPASQIRAEITVSTDPDNSTTRSGENVFRYEWRSDSAPVNDAADALALAVHSLGDTTVAPQAPPSEVPQTGPEGQDPS